MAWPEAPFTPSEFPLVSANEADKLVDCFEVPTPGTWEALSSFLGERETRETLESITEGDPEKERQLGQILFVLAYRTASFAVPQEVKTVRNEIALMELGIGEGEV